MKYPIVIISPITFHPFVSLHYHYRTLPRIAKVSTLSLLVLHQIAGLDLGSSIDPATSTSFSAAAQFSSDEQLTCSIPDDRALRPYSVRVANDDKVSQTALTFVPVTSECHRCQSNSTDDSITCQLTVSNAVMSIDVKAGKWTGTYVGNMHFEIFVYTIVISPIQYNSSTCIITKVHRLYILKSDITY